MKNCQGSAEDLRSLIDSIPAHYKVKMLTPLVFIILFLAVQGDHTSCHSSSSCHMPHYTPSKDQLSDPRTIQKLTETLHSTYIYRNAQEFCRVSHVYILDHLITCYTFTQCRDTFAVESFNHILLTYLSKRIHFSTRTFNMRMNLAVLDWVRR